MTADMPHGQAVPAPVSAPRKAGAFTADDSHLPLPRAISWSDDIRRRRLPMLKPSPLEPTQVRFTVPEA